MRYMETNLQKAEEYLRQNIDGEIDGPREKPGAMFYVIKENGRDQAAKATFDHAFLDEFNPARTMDFLKEHDLAGQLRGGGSVMVTKTGVLDLSL
jgi:hypothetical protein